MPFSNVLNHANLVSENTLRWKLNNDNILKKSCSKPLFEYTFLLARPAFALGWPDQDSNFALVRNRRAKVTIQSQKFTRGYLRIGDLPSCQLLRGKHVRDLHSLPRRCASVFPSSNWSPVASEPVNRNRGSYTVAKSSQNLRNLWS